MIATFALALSAAMLASSTDVPHSAATVLASGIKALEEGDHETALVALDRAVRELSAISPSPPELAQAYLYLGATYAALKQDSLARSKFREAVRVRGDVSLAEDRFPARAVRLFREAQREEQERARLGREARKSTRRGGGLLLGAGIAGAGAIAYGVSRAVASENTPPENAEVVTASQGMGIAAVTAFTFAGRAVDPDGDPLSYAWTFGDGSSATGPSVEHVFNAAGTYTVTVTASDGQASVSATASVTVGDLTGNWSFGAGYAGEDYVDLRQTATFATLRIVYPDNSFVGSTAAISSPRDVRFVYSARGCAITATMTVDATLRSMSGILSCGSCSEVAMLSCGGQSRMAVLTRR